MILVDSNLWAYYLDATVSEHAKVKPLMGRLLSKDDVLHSTVVQIEVLHYLATRLREKAGPVIEEYLAFPGPVDLVTPEIVQETGSLLVRYRSRGVGGRDLAILAQALARKAVLASADRHLLDVARELGVPTIAPLRK